MAHSVAPQAAAQLAEIWHYIAQESGSLEHADRVIDALTERFYLLSTHPRLGRVRNDLRSGLRSFQVGDYVIIYRVTPAGDVYISYILHGRRDLNKAISG